MKKMLILVVVLMVGFVAFMASDAKSVRSEVRTADDVETQSVSSYIWIDDQTGLVYDVERTEEQSVMHPRLNADGVQLSIFG